MPVQQFPAEAVITGAEGVVHLMMDNRRLLCDPHDWQRRAATRTPVLVSREQALVHHLPSCAVCFHGRGKFHER